MKTHWDFWAKRYDRLWVQHASLGPTREAVMAALPVRTGLRILDMGCGTGQLLGDLQSGFGGTPFHYTGVDASPVMIEAAQAKYPEAAFIEADAGRYRHAKASCDVVVCTHAFPYFPDKADVLSRFAQTLKPGGLLLLAQASINGLYDLVVLSLVKLTTTRAQYLSRACMRRLGTPAFGTLPDEHRIRPYLFMPSIVLFTWRKGSEGSV